MERNQIGDLYQEALKRRIDRRAVLRRSAALGLTIPAVSALLTACGADDAGDQGVAPEAPAADQTPTPGETPGAQTGEDATPETGRDTEETAFGEYEEPRHRGGTLVEGSIADARTVNPILVHDTASARITNLIFPGVLRISPKTVEPEGHLAETFEISDDGVEYTFNLRQGITWHDGEPFTAEDVEFTYNLHLDETSGSARTSELLERIAEIEVVDEHTVVFRLQRPVASFLAANMSYGIAPRHILQDVPPEELRQHPFSTGAKGTTIGTGPFMFEEWIKDDHVTLVKNPDYWEGEPPLDRYIFRVVPDQSVLVQQLRTGELDFGGISEPFYQEAQGYQQIRVVDFDTFSFTYYIYQLDPEKSTLFQEKEVRQALLYALDRQGMIDAIRFGLGEVAVGTMPKLSWAYAPEEIELKYEYDPDRARQMLDEAGWAPGPDGIRQKDGQRLSFPLYTNAGNVIREQYVTVMQEQWRQIGVEATPQFEEWNAFLERISQRREFECYLIGFSWGVDPDQSTMWSCDAYEGGFNRNKYCNPEVDRLLEEGLATTDQDERRRIYIEMQNIIVDDLPSAIMDFPKAIAGVNRRVHNLFPNAVSTVYNAHQWWVDP